MQLDSKFYNTFRLNKNGRMLAFNYANLLLVEINKVVDLISKCIGYKKSLEYVYQKFSKSDVNNSVSWLNELKERGVFPSDNVVEYNLLRKHEKHPTVPSSIFHHPTYCFKCFNVLKFK